MNLLVSTDEERNRTDVTVELEGAKDLTFLATDRARNDRNAEDLISNTLSDR
eukprot:CAMPEP_0194100454 /NCGR_PEP_ID=MMETSP0150-20130528/1293_1 /TAXON_ID=122233 /ORGANISM="Chaetoceros debilis, Strain MM31A-1" /LENGTH=51 /DNA_ID=CAMNT_0038786815 /DNA_START=455 /DNA_END=610 /DNA_ORIENTATION=-